MTSILTNNGAIVALQTLKMTNKNLETTQNEISTGKKVASAKDGSSVWAISKIMESDESSFRAIQDSLNVAATTVGTSLAGAEEIEKTLKEMKDLLSRAGSTGFDFVKTEEELVQKTTHITNIIKSSQQSGVNLLQDTVDGTNADFVVISALDRTSGTAATTASKITVSAIDFTTDLDVAGRTSLDATSTTDDVATAIGELDAFIDTATKGAATLGAAAKRIESQSNFVGKLADSLKTGVGSLVDANLEEASARLQALQAQQQLGIQALSVANQAPQSVLSLFR